MFTKIKRGFTIIEILIVLAIIGILVTTMVMIIKPSTQLAKARDKQREADLIAILSIILQYQAEHSGALPDTDGDPATSNFPVSLTCIGSGGSCFNLASAGEDDDTIVPVYVSGIPYDSKGGSSGNTLYSIFVDSNGRLTASASGEFQGSILVTR